MATHTRRRALQLLAASGVAGLAGCLGDDDDDNDDDPGDDTDDNGDGNGDPDTIEITWADHWGGMEVLAEHGAIYFMDRVEEETDGRVQFDYYPGGDLGGATEWANLLQAGTIDVGPVSPQYDSELFPISQVGVLPGYATNAESHSRANWALMDPEENGILYEEEWEPLDFRPLLPYGSAPMYALLTGDPVDDISEIEGMRVRSAGGVNEWTIEAIGASPETMGAEDGYTAIEQGTLDGNTAVLDGIYAFSFQEVTDYIIINAPMNHFVWCDTMRAEVWNDLPEDVQEVFIDVAEETREHWLEQQQEFNAGVIDDLEEDITVHEIPDDQRDDWMDLMDGVTDTWLEFVDNEEVAQDALDTYEQVTAEYED